jgi:hypothetical protein
VAKSAKQEVYTGLLKFLGLPDEELGPGGKEHKPFLDKAARRFGLAGARDTKQGLARRLVERAGLGWNEDYWSRGQTLTTKGLRAILAAMRVLSAEEEDRSTSPPDSLEETRRPGAEYQYREGGIRDPNRIRVLEYDLKALDRSSRAHQLLERRVADFARSRGHRPHHALPPRDPDFDVGWEHPAGYVVVEVKSAHDTNRRQQLRLGLGQVLEYRHILRRRMKDVRAVIAFGAGVEQWERDSCSEAGVLLAAEPSLEADLGAVV